MKTSLPLIAAFSCGAAFAQPVAELKPEELAGFVAAHPLAIVQFTSPDRHCGPCLAASRTFDQVAAESTIPDLFFARVQWTPWERFPDFRPLTKLHSIPAQVVFSSGKFLNGIGEKPVSGQALLENIQLILHGQPPRSALPEPIKRPRQPEEIEAGHLWQRWLLLNAIVTECGRQFPAERAAYQQRFNAWENPRKAELDEATRVFFAGYRTDFEQEKAELKKAEQEALRTWAERQLGVSVVKFPNLDACNKISSNLTSLPKVQSLKKN
jgi:hypothetical protein